MISAATVLTQLFLSCAAILGLVVLRRVLLRRGAWEPINRRFLFGVHVTMALFVGRVLMIATGIEAFRILVLAAAAVVPLAVLLLVEGLLRRHAPRIVKLVIGAGALGFGVLAFWYSDSIDPARLLALLGFQIAGFCAAGWLIITRDRAGLSPGENATVVRLGLSLVLLIPLAAGDFLLARIGLPIQFSALGVLILCWLAIGLGRPYQGHRATLWIFAVMVFAGTFVGAMISFFAELGRDGAMLVTATIMTTLFVVAVLGDARNLRLEEQSMGLLRYLATAQTDDALTFLTALQTHPLVAGAVILRAEQLAGLQDDVLDEIFAAAPVLRKNDPPQLGVVANDHITFLFDQYNATHVILAARRPRALVALALPTLQASPSAELELQVVQRMAVLMSQQEKAL